MKGVLATAGLTALMTVVWHGLADAVLVDTHSSGGIISAYTDTDGDGIPNGSDGCPTVATVWVTPAGDDDCDGFESARETSITTDPDDPCGFTVGAPMESDTWPPDLVETNSLNISDVIAFKPQFGQAVPPAPARYDLTMDGAVNVADVLNLKPFFGKNCVP